MVRIELQQNIPKDIVHKKKERTMVYIYDAMMHTKLWYNTITQYIMHLIGATSISKVSRDHYIYMGLPFDPLDNNCCSTSLA